MTYTHVYIYIIPIGDSILAIPYWLTECPSRGARTQGRVGWGDINIHIDSNMNIHIHIMIHMNIENYISYYLLSIIYYLVPYWY